MKWPHLNHRWKNIKAGHYEQGSLGGLTNRHVTLVLQCCEVCGQLRTEQLDGLWALDDLAPASKP